MCINTFDMLPYKHIEHDWEEIGIKQTNKKTDAMCLVLTSTQIGKDEHE